MGLSELMACIASSLLLPHCADPYPCPPACHLFPAPSRSRQRPWGRPVPRKPAQGCFRF